MAARDLKLRYAGSQLGLFWAIGVPLLTSLVYITVFSILMRGRLGAGYEETSFVIFYFCGYSAWSLFADVLTRSTTLIRENANLVTKITFPTSILPVSSLLSFSITHAVLLALSLGLILFGGNGVGSIAMLPLYATLGAFLALGFSYAVAAISVFVPDIQQIAPLALNLGFFATPVLYTPDLIEHNAPPLVSTLLLKLNPLAHLVEGYRRSLISTGQPTDVFGLVMLVACTSVAFFLGRWVFLRLRTGFADVL